MSSSCFISFEGGEGAGKSTQIRLFSQSCVAAGIDTLLTREPGGSKGAEAIRALLVTGAVDRWHPVTESLLFMTARYDHVETLIRPALADGKWVLCDRFFDSTRIYQGMAKQVGEAWLMQLYTLLYGTLMPDITVLLDIAPDIGLTRAASRTGDETRFEQMELAFHEQLRAGFLRIAKDNPARFICIDASQTQEKVHIDIIAAINQRCALSLIPQTLNL